MIIFMIIKVSILALVRITWRCFLASVRLQANCYLMSLRLVNRYGSRAAMQQEYLRRKKMNTYQASHAPLCDALLYVRFLLYRRGERKDGLSTPGHRKQLSLSE
eukprot:s52_g35.t1